MNTGKHLRRDACIPFYAGRPRPWVARLPGRTVRYLSPWGRTVSGALRGCWRSLTRP